MRGAAGTGAVGNSRPRNEGTVCQRGWTSWWCRPLLPYDPQPGPCHCEGPVSKLDGVRAGQPEKLRSSRDGRCPGEPTLVSTPLPSACTLPVTRAMASSFTHEPVLPHCVAGGHSLEEMIDLIHTLSAQRQQSINVVMETGRRASCWPRTRCSIPFSPLSRASTVWASLTRLVACGACAAHAMRICGPCGAWQRCRRRPTRRRATATSHAS